MTPTETESQQPSAILGWRVWTVLTKNRFEDRDDALRVLLPLYHNKNQSDIMNWERSSEAKCIRTSSSSHHAPEQYCSCGLHAYNKLESAIYEANRYQNSLLLKNIAGESYCVIGLVAGSGRVQKHLEGWRSEKAQILAIAPLRPNDFDNTKSLGDDLCVESKRTLVELAEQFQKYSRDNRFCSDDDKKVVEFKENPLLQYISDFAFTGIEFIVSLVILSPIIVLIVGLSLLLPDTIKAFLGLPVFLVCMFLLIRPFMAVRRSRKTIKEISESCPELFAN